MLNLNRLALLDELHRRGSLHAVGRSLSYSPSTVSQQLKLLEREVGAELLEKAGRGVRLTRQGEILAGHAASILGLMEAAEADVAAALDEPRGVLRIATFQTAALSLLPTVVDLVARQAPQLRLAVVHLDPAAMLDALLARDFDLVLAEEYPGRPLPLHPEVELETLMHDPMVLAAPAHGARLDESRLAEELAASPWVMEPEGTEGRAWVTAQCRAMGFEPEVRFESADLLVQLRFVETGHAVAILPGLLLRENRFDVRQLQYSAERPSRRIAMGTRRGSATSPAIAAVLAAVRSTVASTPGPSGKPLSVGLPDA